MDGWNGNFKAKTGMECIDGKCDGDFGLVLLFRGGFQFYFFFFFMYSLFFFPLFLQMNVFSFFSHVGFVFFFLLFIV
ncbi:hypothetical protein DFH27DRAFT_552522 [Peziza echinospora]|nr:hypothetical protein DFH27DRAFT_552522 [Peziza echinospora]